MYLQYYLMGIILLPGIILATIAQTKVNSAYHKYSQVFASSGVTASELIKKLLSSAGMNHTTVGITHGSLSDHFDPTTNEIRLSQQNYNSSSVSALGIACHEFGHALQKKQNYLPYQIRKTLIPITNFASKLLWPLVIIGLIFNFGVANAGISGDIFMWSGIIVFGASVLINLVTLPVEFDASKRAIKILKTTGTLNEEELSGTKEVLNAAAFTYIASFLVSVLSLLRFLLVVLSRRRD